MLRVLGKGRRAPLNRPVAAAQTLLRRNNTSLASDIRINSAIEELKHISTKLALSKTRITELDRNSKLLGDTYSTRTDGIFRQKNTDAIARLCTLLDAHLEAKEFERAFAVLNALHPLVKEDRLPFVDELNKYLLKYADAESTTIEDLKQTVGNWLQFGESPNAKTYAIMIKKAIEQKRNPTNLVNRYLDKGGSVQDIFAHFDILGVKNTSSMIRDYGFDPTDIPEVYRTFIEDEMNQTDSAQLEADIEAFPPSLGKSAEDLKHVNTYGMRAIRRTLLGLEPHLSDKFIRDLDHELAEKVNFFGNTNSSEINFFNIYKNLPEELQEKFDNALDDFNQERQRQLESNAVVAAQEKWKHDFEELKSQGTLSFSKSLNATLWKWFEDMIPLVQEEINQCEQVLQDGFIKKGRGKPEREKYASFFTLLPANKMAVITILELLKLNSTGGVADGMRTARALVSVSSALELEYRAEQLKRSEHRAFKDLKHPAHLKKYAQSLSHYKSGKLAEWKYQWPSEVKVKVGSLLVSMLMNVAKVPVEGIDPVTGNKVHGEAPAFYHSYQYQSSVKVGVLKIHRSIGSQLSGDVLTGAIQPQFLPMLVKPRPWTSWSSGGYLYSQGAVVRSKSAPEQIAYLKASSDKIDKVYEGLNVLGETAWTVNERIFNIVSKIWNTGEEFLDIPRYWEKYEIPPRPEGNADPSELNEWKKKCQELTVDFNNARSIRCDTNYKLEIARAYLGEKMYFPHNLDFRGRAYPISPNLNHLGNDLSRGLLIFWKGKPLGDKGLRWLKVHLSNLFGIDKAPLHERVQFVEDNLDKVFKTAENPLEYKEWWLSADKPWQALATIFELSDALKSPDPTKFISRQPVHQDGTCNGLQHYAALGGDIEGAKQVNLIPAEKPQDVYTFVAGLLKKRLEKAAANGDEMAIILKDKIKRKIVKQTVMTNVYGVTYIGATIQIDKQLAEVFPEENTYRYSVYLTKHVFACIRELFEGAHLIQDWLALCAKIISQSVRIDMDSDEIVRNGEKPPCMASVIWTTPLNLPIVQPYRAIKKKQIFTNLQTIYIKDPFAMNPVDSRKQVAAFPPNFIHSLDATHMLLSAIACGQKGLDFAAVHDSYWTHAGDVDAMNEALRDEFIKLHEVDLIEKLKNEFDERYKGFLRLVQVPRDSEAAKKVIELKKDISKQLGRRVTMGDEIYLERKRQLLLNSEDPDEVKRGQETVTTVSLLENEDLDSLVLSKPKRHNSKKVEVVEESLTDLSEESDLVEENEAVKKFMKVLAPLKLPDIPPKGNFDVQDLRNSQYFFS